MRWSYSRLSTFEQCKYEFYLNYIINDDEEYLAENNYYAEVGSFVHKILEKIFTGELKIDDAVRYYIDNFNQYVIQKTKPSVMKNTFEACADYFASIDLDWIKDYEILGVELETKFKINNFDFVGYIDLLLRDKRDNKIVIIDHKSAPYPLRLDGKVKKNSQASFQAYKKQMYLYSYAVKEIYGEYPKEIRWNHFKAGGKFVTIPFQKKEYNKAIKWFTDTIHNIEKENEFNPTLNYFYCNNLCNFRHCCEYCKDSDWRENIDTKT